MEILAEVHRTSAKEARAYILGAARDGTINRLHRTLERAFACTELAKHIVEALRTPLARENLIRHLGTLTLN